MARTAIVGRKDTVTPPEGGPTALTGRAAMAAQMDELQIPRDPSRAGLVGKGRRAAWFAIPDPDGNRAARRAAKRAKR